MFAAMPAPSTIARPYVVGVTGGSSSGKTSFVRALRERLGDTATFFSQDDYYLSTDDIARDAGGVHNFDLPSSIDSVAMAADVKRVCGGETLTRTEYTFQTIYAHGDTEQTGRVGSLMSLRPAPIVVIEGLFVLHEVVLTQLMDLRLFVDASDVAKLSRRIKRDRVERKLPLEDVLYRYERHVLPAYRTYIEPHRNDSDLIVNNERGFDAALDVVIDHLNTVALGAREA